MCVYVYARMCSRSLSLQHLFCCRRVSNTGGSFPDQCLNKQVIGSTEDVTISDNSTKNLSVVVVSGLLLYAFRLIQSIGTLVFTAYIF